MYIPNYFQIKDLAEIENFLNENAFGILISSSESAPIATHIPIELHKTAKGEWLLRGHVARANPHWKSFEENPSVLCIFQSAHHYVSASWYSKPNASTWNYQALHVYGTIRIVTEAELLQSLEHLTNKYEANSQVPLTFEKLPPEMISDYLKAIVGFEIKVEDVQAKYKLSQNRSTADHQKIVAELQNTQDPNAQKVADEMIRIKII
jgi:transcriptional regulator